MLSRFILTIVIIFTPVFAFAQHASPVSLLADSIFVNQTTGALVASGNVQVFYGDQLVSAEKITFDPNSNSIAVEGQITITDNDGYVFTAEFAEMSPDFQDGLVRGARLLLADQLQLSSAEMRRVAGRFNTMSNVIASSCQVCAERPTPIWQIRANSVIHDQERKQIYFRNATFEVFGFPIAWIPYLRIPDPTVRRTSGFLVPSFLSSDQFGDGLRIPYYVVINDHIDATITPTLSISGAALIDLEYRQRFRSGSIDFFGAFALEDGAGDNSRGFYSLTGQFALPRDYRLNFDMTVVSDAGFMRQFSYDNTDRLVNYATISRQRSHTYVSLGAALLLSLRDDEDNSTIPRVFPEFYYRDYQIDGFMGGKIGYELSSVGLVRDVGQDVFRIGGSADWTVPIDLPYGVQATGFAKADFDIYRVWDNATYPDRLLTSFNPQLGAELRWPLSRQTANARHVLEPVLMLLYTPDIPWNDDVPNEDSLLAEFDETNLFALNRYPGRDASELGWRANIGASYTIYDNDGWQIGLAGGVVLRSNTNTQFTQDILGAVSFEMPNEFDVIGRFLFDEDLNIKRSDIEFDLALDKWDIGGTFVYLSPDPLAGSPVERGEGTLNLAYRVTPSWEIDLNWTRNIVTNTNIQAGAGLTFGNECIEVGLEVNRRFTTNNIVPPSTDINLVVEIAGFGGRAEENWPAARCAF